ncbi:MAG TPA: asparagine synthase-related protein [Sphingomicrobium sp.]|nr:asparagine synthase-related protein [Sphingomicrobium sp.]
MTAIAGYLSLGGSLRPAIACAEMVAAQHAIGPHDQAVRSAGHVAFGRSLFKTLPEDLFDRQPLAGAGGRFLLVADVRLDNRSELSDQLGFAHDEQRRLSDADLLLSAWEKWAEGALDHMLGDFVFAIWESDREQLTLVRSALSMKPLFYHIGSDFIAFASQPSGLHALESNPKSLNRNRAALFAAGAWPIGPSTIFRGISRVEQGHLVRFKGLNAKPSRYWEIDRQPSNFRNPHDYVEAFREHVDRAVAAQLRRAGGSVACHLSGGRDSSAVAGTAARLLAAKGERVRAYTSAPRAGYAGPTIANYMADESLLAAATAHMHPNTEHFICRPQGPLDFANLGQAHRLNPNPMGHLSNFSWWDQIGRTAAGSGASILLIGQVGNLALSAGGEAHLTDLLRERGLASWWRAARGRARSSPWGWPAILNCSLGPLLPRRFHALLMRATGRNPSSFDVPFLRPPYREQAEAELESEFHESRPPRDFFDFRREMLFGQDNSGQLSLVRFGIDERDPTADRRLVEFCFSLPIEALISADRARPLFEHAMSDRIALQVLSSQQRGYQTADWHEIITKGAVTERFNRYKQHEVVSDLIDIDYVQGVIDRWPTQGWGDRNVMSLYRNDVLGVLSLADFIVVNF